MFIRASFCLLASLIVLAGFAGMAQAEVIAEWNFASSANLLVDSSGNGNTLETSGATWSSDAPTSSGLTGSALFNGASTMDTVAAMDLSGYTSVTVSWYQKVTGTSNDGVFAYGYVDQDDGAFSSVVNNNDTLGQGQVNLNCPSSANLDRYVNLYGSSNNAWEEMVAVIDLLQPDSDDVIKLWQNGSFVHDQKLSNDPPATFVADETFFIGHAVIDESTEWYYTGKIAGLKVEGTPVPEPTTATMALLAGGLLVLLIYARRRK